MGLLPRTAACLLSAVIAAGAQEGLAEAERRAEAFDHLLLDLARSLEKGDASAVAAHFAPTVAATPFPRRRTEQSRVTKWIHRHGWELDRTSRDLPASAFARELLAWAPLEFKTKRVRGRIATIAFRHAKDGRWTRGRATAEVVYTEEGLLLSAFRIESLETLVTKRPIFVEIDLGGTDPDVLDHPTFGLAAYGAAAADVDGDGDIDVLATGHDGNVLFVNRGNGAFEKRAVESPRQATGPLFLDYDNDGDPDLFLSANGAQMLLRNDGKGSFRDVSRATGVAKKSIAFSATAGDVNGDGYPDIYVTAYNNYGPVAPASWDDARNGLPNLLFVSRGDHTYEEAAANWGVAGNRWSYAAQFVDLDGDSRLDLYVANDFGAGNALYLNRGGRFEDVARKWGVEDNGYAMGVSFGDYDNDGRFDLHVTRMSSTAAGRILPRLEGRAFVPRLEALASGNALYRNLGNGRFEDVSARAGPFHAGWAWGGGFVDIDNDGYLDLHSPNGFLSGKSQKDT